jgi:hypothetical protein
VEVSVVPHFSTEFWIGSIIGILIGILGFGVGVGMDAKTRGEYLFVVGCFCLSALILVSMVGLWFANTDASILIKGGTSVILCGLIIFGTFEAITWAQARHEHATAKPDEPAKPSANLEAEIPKWVTANGWKATAMPGLLVDNKPVKFAFMIDLPSTGQVLTFLNPDWPNVLQLQSKMFLPPDLLQILNDLSRADADAAMTELKLEMTRLKINFKITTMSDQPMDKFPGKKIPIHQQSILLSNPTPIDGLNEFAFSKAVAEMDNNIAYVYTERELILKRYGKSSTKQRQ